jgi:hypothetical protein
MSSPVKTGNKNKAKQQLKLVNGWYRVEGITGHRVSTTDSKWGKLELRVKWEGY